MSSTSNSTSVLSTASLHVPSLDGTVPFLGLGAAVSPNELITQRSMQAALTSLADTPWSALESPGGSMALAF